MSVPPPYPGQPWGATPPPPTRPGVLTAAAVLGFVVGGFSVLGGLGALGLTTLGFARTLFIVIGVVNLFLAVLYIWGGITALGGRNSQILVIACAISIVVNLVSLLQRFEVRALVPFILPILILALALNRESRQWIRMRGGATF